MAPPLLQMTSIRYTLGGKPLLDGVDLQVGRGDRICLVGRNGSGKSTLMKVVAGDIGLDGGTRFLQPDATLRVLPQEPDLAGYDDVLSYVEAGLGPLDNPYRARSLLDDLGLTGDEKPGHLSGGELRRAALARVLAPEPDILLLDEPTNHLDLPAIEWLENELKSLCSALVLVSHDRRFLTNLSRSTVWLDRGRTRRIDQGFGAFEDWRDQVLEEEELERHKLDRKIAREEDWVRYGVSGRRKRNVRRMAELGDLRREKREASRVVGLATMTVSEGKTSGKLVVEAEGRVEELRRPAHRARPVDPGAARGPARHRGAERRRQDDAAEPPHRPRRARHRHGEARRQRPARDARPGALEPQAPTRPWPTPSPGAAPTR